jgi:hypothetical protein
MTKKRSEPRRMSPPTLFEQARDELFSHILRCGVLEAGPEHQKEWFDDTMLYLADRYDGLDERQLAELRVLGERYCRPVVGRNATVGASV